MSEHHPLSQKEHLSLKDLQSNRLLITSPIVQLDNI
ncbi:hypothetical protein K6959_07670 [Bacillus aquiflavi]|nr:hypothetical protein K6959_07670 [Bacillus aquiflavi]